MNPQSGLKIRPFKNAATAQATDRELLKLSKYLSVLKEIDDFRSLDHRNWEKVTQAPGFGEFSTSTFSS
jgi:ubiquitin-like domain-containing CTD phosphatase 1